MSPDGGDPMTMSMLYESDRFIVVHVTYVSEVYYSRIIVPTRFNAFEICDKPASEMVLLTREQSDAFAEQTRAWQENVPHPEEVEAALDAYMQLGRTPLCVH